MVDTAAPYTSITMDPTPYRVESTPNALLESLPAVNRGVVYRYLRQTTQTNNAAPVAPGALKPTSVFGLVPVDGRLRVIAHVSEAIDKYVLQDGPSLTQFVQMEMVDGLHRAVEAQLLSGTGLGENIAGLAAVSGIQAQALAGDKILTARSAITKVEVLGFTPSFFVLAPADWEAVEKQQSTGARSSSTARAPATASRWTWPPAASGVCRSRSPRDSRQAPGTWSRTRSPRWPPMAASRPSGPPPLQRLRA